MDNFENTIKKLIKTGTVSDWLVLLEDENFLSFLKTYEDVNQNNVYHLLFKVSKSNTEKILLAVEIAQICLEKGIPIFKYNNESKLPSDLAEGKTFFVNKLKQQEFNELQNQIQND